jgi:hypothetical protein
MTLSDPTDKLRPPPLLVKDRGRSFFWWGSRGYLRVHPPPPLASVKRVGPDQFCLVGGLEDQVTQTTGLDRVTDRGCDLDGKLCP